MSLVVWPNISEPALVAVTLQSRQQAALVGIKILVPELIARDEFKTKSIIDTVGNFPAREKTEGSDPDRVSFNYTETPLTALNYAEEIKITSKAIKDAVDPIRPFEDGSKFMSNRQMLGQEVRILTALTDTAVITQTAAVSNAWTDITNGTPEADIRTGIVTIGENSGTPADTLLLSVRSANNLAKHPDVKNVMQHTSAELLVGGLLPPKLWGLDVEIAMASQVSATGIFTQVLSNKAVICTRKDMGDTQRLGRTYFSEPFEIILGPVSDNRRFRMIFSNFTYLPVVDVPTRAYILTAIDS